MRRGTTPTIILSISEINLTEMKSVYITFKSPCKWAVTKREDSEGVTIQEHTIAVLLTQEETLKFKAGKILVQVRCLANDDTAYATEIAEFTINDILLDGVID